MKKLVLILVGMLTVLTACGGSDTEGDIDTIVFADGGWDSVHVHNNIAQTIIEEGYGYETDETFGSGTATFLGLREGEINVYMEAWTDNIKEMYEEGIESGDVKELATNFNDNEQGLYVPTYVIEGDPERGIEPLAPDLKTVEDLKNYPEIFKDPEDPERGRVVNAPSGWGAGEQINDKFEVYGLNETFNNFMPGSDTAIVADLAAAYEAGEAWVGYHWSPTWATAEYDLTLLAEDPYDEELWHETRATEFPPNDVTIVVHKDLAEQAPDVVEFLSNYETNTELTEQALIYMDEHEASAEEAAEWWMKEHEDVWVSWIPEDIAEKVKESLE